MDGREKSTDSVTGFVDGYSRISPGVWMSGVHPIGPQKPASLFVVGGPEPG